jgi:hypothetical protein
MPKKPVIYFYCNPKDLSTQAGYQHYCVALAEGLTLLDVPFYSNVNYWPQTLEQDDFLFNESSDISVEDCDVAVLGHRYFENGNRSLPELFKSNRSFKTVYLDLDDGYQTRSWKNDFRSFDLILKTHWNQNFSYPSNLRPTAFSLTNRIIKATEHGYSWQDRSQDLLANFRVELSLRTMASQHFYPRISSLLTVDKSNDGFEPPTDPYAYMEWEKTGRRHNPSYYQKLNSSQAVSCFGGYFVKNSGDFVSRVLSKLGFKKQILLQWDSWRIWEAWSAGCLVFHVDFEKYGMELPVMPTNWEHYIGIDFDNLDESCQKISALSDQFDQIAANGRKWALANYSPQAVAQRFMDSLEFSAN